MSERAPFGTVVMCEHTVMGEGKKPTLIGVYAGDIQLAEMPGNIWVSLFAEIATPTDPKISHHRVAFHLNEKEIGSVSLELPPPTERVSPYGSVLLPPALIAIQGESTIAFWLTREDEAPVKLIEKRVVPMPSNT